MANIFKRIGNAITNKSVVVPFSPTTATAFRFLGDFLSFSVGAKDASIFTKSYGENPLVYSIVKKVSFKSASITRIVEDDKGETIENSKILELLKKPNKTQTQVDFLEEIKENLQLTGNAFVRFVKGIGMGEGLEVLITANVEVIVNNAGTPLHIRYTKPNGSRVIYDLEDIDQIRTSNVVAVDKTAVLYGLSPLSAGWIVVQSSSEKLKADASIFKNRGIIGILTNKSKVPMLGPEKERLQKELDDEVGGADKFNKIKISSSDLNYIQTGMSPTDLKLIEGLLKDLRLLCSIYGISSVILNDTANSTYNNVDSAKIDAYLDAYIPLAEKVDASLSIFLSKHLKVNETLKLDLTSIEVIKANTSALATALNNLSPLIVARVMEELSSEEVRGIVDLLALDNNQARIGSSGSQTQTTIDA